LESIGSHTGASSLLRPGRRTAKSTISPLSGRSFTARAYCSCGEGLLEDVLQLHFAPAAAVLDVGQHA
jgi:hypothetical protein